MGVDDYKFLQIADAVSCINQKVNLIGVAAEITLPKSTKGTDCFCSVKIIDESRPSGIQVSFFMEDMEKLPLIENVGDIVLVSRVVIKSRGSDVSDVYALFNKKFSTFALYEWSGSNIKELVPYQISPRYEPRDQDKKNIMQLRKWFLSEKIEDLHESLFLRELKEPGQINLLCKILHVAEVKEDEWMMFIWDGTDAPPLPVESELETEMKNPLPLALETSPLSRDLLCTFPYVGTVLRVTVDQGQEKLGIKFLKTNRWARFIGLKCETLAGLWRGVLTPYSKLFYLPDEDDIVMLRQRTYEERVPSKWGRMPFSYFPFASFPYSPCITETDHPDVATVTLMDILTYPEVTYLYKTVVRIVALFPTRAENFRCSNTGVYRVRVTLEDPTARIHAYLYKEDGEKFFKNCQSLDALTKMRNALLGVPGEDSALTLGNVARNPPWIECCLKSYYIDKADIWGSRNYRIFDTKCVG